MISSEDKGVMGEMGRTSKERVMIYILSKLEYIFARLLQGSNVNVDSLQTICFFFIQEFKHSPLLWPTDYSRETERVYKQPRCTEEFPMTSLLMGRRDTMKQILSKASHTTTHTGMTSSTAYSRFHITVHHHLHQKCSVTLTHY